jgi:putative transcriptional regulator
MALFFSRNLTRHFKEVSHMGKIVLRLDRVMADRKMSLNELSEKVGVSNVNLSKIKTGKISAVRFSTLEAICEVLDCQPGDILEYDKNA